MPATTLTEAQFTRQVIELAQLCGWRVAHFRAAMTGQGWRTPCQGDAKGFPDLVLVHPKRQRVLYVELKVGDNTTTPHQAAWLEDLNAAGEYAKVWRETDWDEIEELLRGG